MGEHARARWKHIFDDHRNDDTPANAVPIYFTSLTLLYRHHRWWWLFYWSMNLLMRIFGNLHTWIVNTFEFIRLCGRIRNSIVLLIRFDFSVPVSARVLDAEIKSKFQTDSVWQSDIYADIMIHCESSPQTQRAHSAHTRATTSRAQLERRVNL